MNSNYQNINEVYPTQNPTPNTPAPNTNSPYPPQYQNPTSNMNCQYQSTMNVPQYQTSYPNGIAPPTGSVVVNQVPVIPMVSTVPVYAYPPPMPLCMRCGGTGYIYGKRCVCIGGKLSNSELLGMGLLGMGYGYGPYYRGYW